MYVVFNWRCELDHVFFLSLFTFCVVFIVKKNKIRCFVVFCFFSSPFPRFTWPIQFFLAEFFHSILWAFIWWWHISPQWNGKSVQKLQLLCVYMGMWFELFIAIRLFHLAVIRRMRAKQHTGKGKANKSCMTNSSAYFIFFYAHLYYYFQTIYPIFLVYHNNNKFTVCT